MPSNQIQRLHAPIKVVQTTLNKFDPSLPEPKNRNLTRVLEESELIKSHGRYHIQMTGNNTIVIQEMYCFDCGRRLVKNGLNSRLIIPDNGLGRFEFKLQRKRCPYCGEIKPDYSSLAPKFGNYHENYKRITRQLHLEDLVPRQIKKTIEICFNIKISESTIVRWINLVSESLHLMLDETPVPSSGYFGYDEIHMLIGGKKKYQIDTVDLVTKFIPMARIMPSMGRKAGNEVLKSLKRGRQLQIYGIVKDCSTNLGKLFQKHGWTKIMLQNCLTHVKWNVIKHVKAFSGLSRESKKPVPKEWRWLVRRFYDVIDSRNDADMFIKMEILENTISKLKGKKLKHLHTALKQIKGWLPKIVACRNNPNLSKTNNLNEAYHRKYGRYTPFKRNMMTIHGAQRISDFCRFNHNFGRFPEYIEEFRGQFDTYRALLTDWPGDPSLRGMGLYFRRKKEKLKLWFGEYSRIWNDFFAKI